MTDQSFSTTMTVEQAPDHVFDAINDPTAWFSQKIEGRTDHVDAEFVFEAPGLHSWHFKITELDRPHTVVWRVLDTSSTDFVDDKAEWNNTEIRFDLSQDAEGTHIRFTHAGLVPELECFEACSTGWGHCVGKSLHAYITTGKGHPVDE